MAESRPDLGDYPTDVGLPETGDFRIVELLRSQHPAIAEAVRRVQQEAELGQRNYAAFGSTP